MKGKKEKAGIRKCLLIFYVLIQLILLVAIHWGEARQPYRVTGKIMYSVIVMNFLAAAVGFVMKQAGKTGTNSKSSASTVSDHRSSIGMILPENTFIFLALTFTLAADYFLTLTDTHYNLGVFLFCIVQTIYAVGLGFSRKNILFRGILFCLFTVILFTLLQMTAAVSVLEGYSIAMLTVNIVTAFAKYFACRKNISEVSIVQQTWLLLAIGLLLFAGCDLCVGLRNALRTTAGLEGLCSFLNFMIWNFYLPAQLLITLSWIKSPR